VNLDTSNPMESGATVLDLLPEVAPRVVHVHASDRAADLSHVVTGTGVVPFVEVFRHLKAVGFSGYLSMEIGGPPERASVEASAANVRRLWAEAG
jgi:sugar phosphate isomerase/epimerase